MLKKFNIRKAAIALILICGVLFIGNQAVAAINRGYGTDDTALKPGFVVALSEDSSSDEPKVERASADQINRVVGVVNNVDNSLITISSGEQAVYVESSGEVDAFVTDAGGDIRRGDFLTLSPLRGILAKATPNQPIVATALEDFVDDNAQSYTVQSETGTTEVLVKQLRINIDQKSASSQEAEDTSSLQRLGRSLTGKDVGDVRVLIAIAIFFIVMVVEGTIIYGAISSSIISLGRNPLARGAIKSELVRVLFVTLAVLLLGVVAIYAILWA